MRGHFFSPVCHGLLVMGLVLCRTESAKAQLIQQYFPSGIPGYEPDFSDSVVTRMNTQNLTDGIELGDFIIRPVLSETAGYNSNVLGAPNSGSSSIDSVAAVRLNSDWGRDALGASFSVDDRRYLQLPSANFMNWSAGLGGGLTLGDDTATLAYSHLALHLNATDPGVIGVVSPVPYSIDDVRMSYAKLFARVSITPQFEYQRFVFGQSSGGTNVNYDSLDHQTESGTVTAQYEFTPGDAAVLVLRSTQAQFSLVPGDNYLDLSAFAGLDFRGDDIIQFRTLLGLERRSFNAAATVTTPTFELDAVWTPTQLDTVTGTAIRQQDDPTSPFAHNQIITHASVELDHELRTNVFFRATAGGGESESQGGAGLGTARQTQMSFGASFIWNINRHMRASLGYGYNHSAAAGGQTQITPGTFGYSTFTSQTVLLGISFLE